jgi:hypothetical protein
MIYYNKKGITAKFQTGGQTPKEFQTEYIQSPKYTERLKSSGYKAIPQVVGKRLGQVEQTGLNKYKKTLGQAIMSLQGTVKPGSHFDKSRVNIDYKTDLPGLKKSYPGMTMPSPIEVEAHEFSHPSVAKLDGLPQENIMNAYDNKQLLGRSQRLPYVNDHDKRANENKADIDAYRYMLKQKGVYDAGKETFTKEHLKNNSKNFSRERLKRNYSDKNLIWLMNNVASASSPSVPSASPPVAGPGSSA